MRVESEAGKGSTFKLYLPSVAQPPEVKDAFSAGCRGGTETVLVVDDEAALAALVSENLEADGYTVLRAGSAEEAIRMCDENFLDIDLLLSDVVLPNMSGPELAEHITAANPCLPVLFMSGYPDEVIQHYGVFHGALNLVEKPFTRTQLALKVREVLDSAQVRPDRR